MKAISLLIPIIFYLFAYAANAQSIFKALYEDEEYQVVKIQNNNPFVNVDGKTKSGSFAKSILATADEFGEGFVEIETVVSEIRKKKQNSEKAQTMARNSFLYHEVILTADRNMKNCFCVLTFGVNGSFITKSESVGSLAAGKPKRVKIIARTSSAKIGKLHVYSRGNEIRSNLIPTNYSLIEDEYRVIERETRGVSPNLLFGEKNYYPHRLSPTGKYLATFRDIGKTNTVYIFNVDNGTLHNKFDIGEYNQSVYSLTWISEEEFIFVVDQTLKRVHIDDTEAEDLKRNVRKVAYTMPLDKNRILLASTNSLRYQTFNLKTLKIDESFVLSSRSSKDWFDEEGRYRLKEYREGKNVRYAYRHKAKGRWIPLDETVTQKELVFNFSGDSEMEQQTFIHDFGIDPDILIVFTTVQSDTAQLAEYSLSEGRIKRYLIGNKVYDLGGAHAPDSRILYRNKKKEIIGTYYHASIPRTKWFAEDFKMVQELFDQTFPDTINTATTWTDDATTIVFTIRSEKHPGKVVVFRPLEQRAFVISNSIPVLDNYELGDMKPIKFAARDGYTLRGYLTLPPNYSGEKLPLITYPHGGPWARDFWGYDGTVQYFATRGYAVLQVNYRGSEGYGKKHLTSGVRGVDTVMIDDVADGVKYCISEGFIDPEKIGIYGGSFGGYSVYMGMIKYPDIYKAGVAFAAVSDYGKQLKHRKTTGQKFNYAFWSAALGKYNEEAFMQRISPVYHAEKIKGPLLIFHGKKDYTVPWEQAKYMKEALEEAGGDFKLTYFDEEGHGFYYIQNRIRHLDETEDFFAEKLRVEHD